MLSSFKYYFRGYSPKAVGDGVNINQLPGIADITVKVVPDKGPYEEGEGEGAPTKRVVDFWVSFAFCGTCRGLLHSDKNCWIPIGGSTSRLTLVKKVWMTLVSSNMS